MDEEWMNDSIRLACTQKFFAIIKDQSFHATTPQPFYGPFSGTTWVSRRQKRTSGLYGARGE